MLQQESAQDYVIATGVAHSVREFVLAAFKHVGVEITSVHDPSNSVCPCHAANLPHFTCTATCHVLYDLMLPEFAFAIIYLLNGE